MGQFLFGPAHETLALPGEQRGQFLAAAGFLQHRFLLAANVEIHQRQVDLRQPFLLAHQVAIDAQLRPVQVAMIVGQAGKLAAIGLHFFQQLAPGIVAVGPTPHVQRAVLCRQRHFALVALAAPLRHDGVTGDTFLGGGCGRKAQVEIALFGSEFAQGAH